MVYALSGMSHKGHDLEAKVSLGINAKGEEE